MFYDEINVKGDNSDDSTIATDTDANEIDYDKLEDSFYNALDKYYKDNKNESINVSAAKVNNSQNAFDLSGTVDFASSTDAKLYTCQYVDSPSSVAEQELGYLLDIRNILLIFLFVYFIISIYGKLKSTLINYYERS